MFDEDGFFGSEPEVFDWKVVRKTINETMLLIREIKDEYPAIFEKGEDFFYSVYDGLGKLRETIKVRRCVTRRQFDAVQNWTEGVHKWHPDYK